jgi:HSP20 family protein
MKKQDLEEIDLLSEDSPAETNSADVHESEEESLSTDWKTQKIEVQENDSPLQSKQNPPSENLFGKEGELAIDVYQTDENIIIQSAIAGVRAEDLDVQIENDVVTIRGVRSNPSPGDEKEYFHEECFWGPFSRQVFLPEEIDVKNVEASMQEGIFTLRLPKMLREKSKKVKIAKK